MNKADDIVSFFRPEFLPGIEIVSVRYVDRAFPTHSHPEYVVGTVLNGAEILNVRGVDHVVAAGDVLLLHPDEAHSNRAIGNSPLHYIVFYLAPGIVASHLDDTMECSDLHFSTPVASDKALSQAIADTHAALTSLEAGRLEQESALLSLIGALAERYSIERPRARDERGAVAQARSWIDTHFQQNFGLADVAAICGLSVYRFAHLFKDVVGLSPIAYRNQCRVIEARRLLTAGQSIAEAAHEVGFADQSHLTRQFQRIVGTTPGKYLQQ